MKKIIESDIKYICDRLKNWETIPVKYKEAIFWKEIEKKEYELKYSVKEREEDIIANTYASPLQKVKTFHSDEIIEHNNFIREPETKYKFKGWYNKLIFWDNLQVLKELLTNELLQKQIQENWWIKLIYIDPPFATKSDFSAWQGEKAYSDKVAWAEFIEFIRKRLVLMKELLADDWSIYVHLDWKKLHYIKVVMDEIFWEDKFMNEIIWHYQAWTAPKKGFAKKHDSILVYVKSKDKNIFNPIRLIIKDESIYPLIDKDWRKYRMSWNNNATKYYADAWRKADDMWTWLDRKENNIWQVFHALPEKLNYPTQKPEKLLERIIKASSNKWDIVLDAFSWSGTTIAVAEKLGRKWIGIDWWKLSIYTIQNRLMNLKEEIWNKWKDLKPKQFAVYNAWLYDFKILKNLDWDSFVWFTLSLFWAKQEKHNIDWIPFDWKLNMQYVQVFDYNHWREWIALDRSYLENLNEKIWTKIWKRIYIIAPATKIDWIMEDVVNINWREYFLLRVPYSILKELYTKEFEKIKQPTSEDDVNNTVEAVWFDFIRVPKIKVEYSLKWNKAEIKINTFESKVISKKKLDFKNLETLSTVIIDYEYNWEYLSFEKVLFADKIKKNNYIIEIDKTRLNKKCMIVYIDIFWNEKKEIITLENFKK
jgi:DNA modification methylase